MTENHALLQNLTLSTPTSDAMITVAMAAGAPGAKVTGAGDGGSMIALADSDATQARVMEAMRSFWREVYDLRAGPNGTAPHGELVPRVVASAGNGSDAPRSVGAGPGDTAEGPTGDARRHGRAGRLGDQGCAMTTRVGARRSVHSRALPWLSGSRAPKLSSSNTMSALCRRARAR